MTALTEDPWTPADSTDVESATTLPGLGVHEWRVPSAVIPGMHVLFLAAVRMRGGCGENFPSPQFDRWTGWRAVIPAGTSWRPAPEGADLKGSSYALVRPEGVEPDACPFCRRTPRFEARETGGGSGVVVCGVPHRFDAWSLVCCQWARSPTMRSPIELVERRRAALALHGSGA